MDIICIGLGNPGRMYSETRHNVGFWFLDRLASALSADFAKPWFRPWEQAEAELGGNRVILVKPLTYMNRSGAVFEGHERFLPGEGRLVLVACDQMDLPPGQARLKRKGGTAGHNGLKSIHAAIGDAFLPLYLGIGRPEPGTEVVDHVLGVPSSDDRAAIDLVLARVAPEILRLAGEPFDLVAGCINRKTDAVSG